ncbi:MAG: Ig-like domain-containing protein [Burkholderiaceae bacterium]
MTSTQSPWIRLLAYCSMVIFALVTAACSGNGAGAGGGGSSAAAASSAASLSLISSETSLGSDGKKTAVITAIVKNELNVSLGNQPVVFSTSDNGATLEIADSITDASGRMEAVLSVTDRTVRDITITAASGDIVRSIVVPVVGTVLQINGSSTIVFNDETQYSISLRDSGGSPILNAEVQVSSANGNIISESSITTDSQGQAVFNVRGVNAGADTLTASSQGVTTVFPTSVSGTQLTYVAPDNGLEVTVDQVSPVTVRLIENGAPVVGRDIRFAVTRGVFAGSSTATTDGSGEASVSIQSPTAGISTITATEVQGTLSTGVTATRQIEFVSKSPTKIELQASPAVVGANLSTEGTNSSQLIAVVRDDNDNPVKNVRVDFSALTDPSNGRIEPGFGITDRFGTATASFIAGPTATGFDAVQLEAKLSSNAAIFARDGLTVSDLELSVRIGTGNELISDDSLTAYRMPWTAIVADSSGNPVENALVTVALRSTRYRKGFWTPVADGWIQQAGDLTTCVSEDTNLNGRLDSGEDLNGSLELDPGSVSVSQVLQPGSRTDSSGLASIEVIYPKTYGAWVESLIQVTITTVSGTEASAEQVFILPVEAGDINNISILPPGATAPDSPFGRSTNCGDTL